jgi:ribosomal protein S6E (S10)
MYSTLAGKKVLKMFGKKTMSLVPLNISFHVRGGTTKLGFPLHADWLYKGYIRALV